MGWSESISLIQDVLAIVALLGAIWSAYAFIRGLAERSEEVRINRKNAWLRASVHKILHSSQNFLSVGEILARLKSSSFDEDFPIQKHELTERELRLVLLEGLEKGYLDQLWGDIYGVSRRDPIADKAFLELSNHDLVRDAYDLITVAKSGISTDEIIQRIGRDGIKPSAFNMAMNDLVARKLVTHTKDGMWMPSQE